MIAVIDETTIEHENGLVYVLATAILIESQHVAADVLLSVVKGRQRPFHWVKEGVQARQRMMNAVDEVGAVARGYQAACGRRGQDAARSRLLPFAVCWAGEQGARVIIIEGRGHKLDIQDKRVIKKMRAAGHQVPEVQWDSKANPLLWLADAVCGSHRDTYLAEVAGRAADPRAAGIIRKTELEVTYIQT